MARGVRLGKGDGQGGDGPTEQWTATNTSSQDVVRSEFISAVTADLSDEGCHHQGYQ